MIRAIYTVVAVALGIAFFVIPIGLWLPLFAVAIIAAFVVNRSETK